MSSKLRHAATSDPGAPKADGARAAAGSTGNTHFPARVGAHSHVCEALPPNLFALLPND